MSFSDVHAIKKQLGLKDKITRDSLEAVIRETYLETKGSINHYRTFKRDFVTKLQNILSDENVIDISPEQIKLWIDHAERGYGFGTSGFVNNLSFNLHNNIL